MIWPTVMRGLREEKGSWKIICIFFLRALSCAPFAPVMSWPSKQILPPVGSSRWRMVRPSVDLPQPDSPTTPRVSPLFMLMLTSSTACR